MSLPLRVLLACCGLAVAASGAAAQQPDPAAAAQQPDPKGVEFFEMQIRPLLVAHCYKCHSAEAKTLRGGLRLDSRTGWMAGGDSGAAIVPGKPDESRLIRAVRYNDSDLQMPPQQRLSPQQIKVLEEWVRRGAPDPRTDAPVATRHAASDPAQTDHWAFRPPVEPEVPPVQQTAWPRSPLDRFVLAGLEAKGLAPAPKADKAALIRRATFDLTGLPPTPEETAAFLADKSPQAFACVVERLLASPHYGEHWGRYWLDVARYADSNGLDENLCYGNAWRYRDWVVTSFNRDLPIDEFLIEQLAGDLLPPGDDEAQQHARLIATGFLSLGPKVLAEVDERKMEMDIIDEQISTVGTAILGLTLGCARCHDHKFDPITTEDYYGLAGIFKSTRTMENFKKIARWYENSIATAADLARKQAYDDQLRAQKQQIDEAVRKANEALKGAASDGKLPAKPEEQYPDETKAELKRLRDALAALEKSVPEMPMAMGVSEGIVAAVPVHIRGSHLNLGKLVARRFPEVLDPQQEPLPEDQSGRLQLARWLTRPDHPLTSRVFVNRVWHWHFGQGLVRTPDNFGCAGEESDNPQLLDWLSRRLVESGWSLKAMHRLIMLSSTYQMSSRYDAQAARVDPQNRLLWRVESRRLESEAIRDALLMVGGSLDLSLGGSLLKVKDREFFFDHTSKDGTTYDSPRRSLYLPIVRNHLYDVFQLFDSPDPATSNGNRATTTIAPQALFMMNGGLVGQAAERLAQRLLDDQVLDNAGRVTQMYAIAYGRPPTEYETARDLAFVERFGQALAAETADAAAGPPAAGDTGGPEADGDGATPQDAAAQRLAAWQALCQTVLAANEFVYIQ